MDEELPYRILNVLRDLYIEEPTSYVGIDYFEPVFDLPENEIHGALIYLKEKDWIKSFKDEHGEWVQRINAKGVDELLSYEKIHADDYEPLEFDVSHEDHTGKIKVFISHKFVKSDQKLADELREYLDNHSIYGYLAERKKEYDIVFGEKIKNEIKSSDYLVAIITKNSHFAPSVHQEIGYAMGIGVPVRVMAEGQEARGVLVEGKDIEKFSRQNFEKSLDNIMKNIKKNGIRTKLDEKITKKEICRVINNYSTNITTLLHLIYHANRYIRKSIEKDTNTRDSLIIHLENQTLMFEKTFEIFKTKLTLTDALLCTEIIVELQSLLKPVSGTKHEILHVKIEELIEALQNRINEPSFFIEKQG